MNCMVCHGEFAQFDVNVVWYKCLQCEKIICNFCASGESAYMNGMNMDIETLREHIAVETCPSCGGKLKQQ